MSLQRSISSHIRAQPVTVMLANYPNSCATIKHYNNSKNQFFQTDGNAQKAYKKAKSDR